jgi:hypothetical protein
LIETVFIDGFDIVGVGVFDPGMSFDVLELDTFFGVDGEDFADQVCAVVCQIFWYLELAAEDFSV